MLASVEMHVTGLRYIQLTIAITVSKLQQSQQAPSRGCSLYRESPLGERVSAHLYQLKFSMKKVKITTDVRGESFERKLQVSCHIRSKD